MASYQARYRQCGQPTGVVPLSYGARLCGVLAHHTGNQRGRLYEVCEAFTRRRIPFARCLQAF